ncbi:hypothetical protein L596_007829 [Steinernema carpocapsae]|uniref:Protein kinase domain-containing protein n=1 Tax=Steinernema carpocapsae TaxID=34508 RepID=A0A4V6A651_STECR|nr:hypothetical protein L596_007829 [Steinernema carpocapsae]
MTTRRPVGSHIVIDGMIYSVVDLIVKDKQKNMSIFKVNDSTGAISVVKELKTGLRPLDDVDAENEFRRQLQISQMSPHVVKAYDRSIEEDPAKKKKKPRYLMRMEYAPRQCLRRYMEKKRPDGTIFVEPLPYRRAWIFYGQILCGLGKIHRLNVYHKDIALRNIFVFSDHTCKIGDFGVAWPATQEESRRDLTELNANERADLQDALDVLSYMLLGRSHKENRVEYNDFIRVETHGNYERFVRRYPDWAKNMPESFFWYIRSQSMPMDRSGRRPTRKVRAPFHYLVHKTFPYAE